MSRHIIYKANLVNDKFEYQLVIGFDRPLQQVFVQKLKDDEETEYNFPLTGHNAMPLVTAISKGIDKIRELFPISEIIEEGIYGYILDEANTNNRDTANRIIDWTKDKPIPVSPLVTKARN